MVQKGVLFLLLAVLMAGGAGFARAESADITLQSLGPDEPSPFTPQLFVKITNESFVSYPLQEKMDASELWVDGHSYPRLDKSFSGPAGLGPKNSWQGCVPLEGYLADGLAPGRHRLLLRLGESRSTEIRLTVAPLKTAGDSPEERLKETQALVNAFPAGLFQSCVEYWLTERDGGIQNSDRVRYYVDPGVKALVSYEEGKPEPRVKGKIRLYLESRVAD